MLYQHTEQKPRVLLLIGAVHILYQSHVPFGLGITPVSVEYVYTKRHFPNVEIKLTQCQGHTFLVTFCSFHEHALERISP